MENTKIFESIGDFSLFLKNNNTLSQESLDYFNQIRAAHENTFGGCGCNRRTRIANSINIYKKFISECSNDKIQDLKNSLNVSILIFKHEQEIFAQF